MKLLISILILLAGVWLFLKVAGVYDRSMHPGGVPTHQATPADTPGTDGQSLPGLPTYLESSLAEAQQQGVDALGQWLKTWSKYVQDPRLAGIELDYVVLLNLKDHAAARERFREVEARITPASPVYPRLKKLESAYEQ